MNESIMGWAPDSYQHMWNLWWVRDSALSLRNPFRTELLFYPQGSDLYMHTLTPVNGVLSSPLQLATGNVLLSWDLLSLTFFTASGVAAYALAYHVTSDTRAALMGGVIFAFSPFVMTHIHGHLNISTTWPIPIFVLSVLKLHETQRSRFAVIAGVMFAVMTWNWLEFAIDSGLFLILFAFFWGTIYLHRRDRGELEGLVRRMAMIVAVWLPLSLPILIPTSYEVLSGDIATGLGMGAPAEFYSADILGFVTPSPLWGPGEFSKGDTGTYPTVIGGVEGTVYLGILPLLLAIIAIIAYRRSDRRKTVAFWSLVFGFFVVMAMGPYLYVNGDKTFDIGFWEFSVSLPFRIFKEIPLIGLRRAPTRMVVYAMLALCVLAPLGLSALTRAIGNRSQIAAQVLALVGLALVLLEFWNPPVSLSSFDVPAVYSTISQEQGDFALLELPVGRITGTVQRGDIVGGGMAQYSQITHGKASIGGYFSRGVEKDVAWLREQPGLKYLSCSVCPGYPDAADNDASLVRDEFAQLRIKYVIVNLQTFEGQPTSLITDGNKDAILQYLQDIVGLEEIDRGDGWIAYRNPGYVD